MFKILRYFSIVSLAGIVLTAVLLTVLYRQMVIGGIVQLGEQSNLALAQTALNSVRAELVKYLAHTGNIDKEGAALPPIGTELDQAIQGIMKDTTVVRVKIYNQNGIVVFSTKTGQIGQNQRNNPGFSSAYGGQVASKLIYHDTFNPFDEITEDDNLIQTYLPVRHGPTTPIQGVFEIYTDVNRLVDQAEHAEVIIIIGVAIILMLLYVALVFFVRRAERIIETQQNTIRERTKTLELLSAQLLTAQENEKKRIAGDLHEGIAQALSAIKLGVENLCQPGISRTDDENAKALNTLVATIQDAIHEVRAMAMDLRPPSLDDLGILATIDWYCRKFRSAHPEISVEPEIEIEESEISPALKIIIYRVIQETLDNLARHALANQVYIRLHRTNHAIVLVIEDSGRMYKSGETSSRNDAARKIWMATVAERVILSGGAVSIEDKAAGGARKEFTWAG